MSVNFGLDGYALLIKHDSYFMLISNTLNEHGYSCADALKSRMTNKGSTIKSIAVQRKKI